MASNPNSSGSPESDRIDSLETMREGLYSRQEFYSPDKSHDTFKKHEMEVPKSWGEKAVAVKNRVMADPEARWSALKKFFIGSTAFFLVAVAFAFWIFFGGENIVSSNNVDITIVSPVSIGGGEPLPLEITVTNQNNTTLETADLIIIYPEGTRDALDMTLPLKRYREALGTISRGGSVVKKVKAVLFGEEGESKDIDISVEYRVKGSNAIFHKEKKYSISISSAPVTMTISSVKEVNAGQELELAVNVVSNATAVIQNLGISAEYPFGFTFTGSDPTPSWSNSFWHLGDLKPAAKRSIKVRGTIAGQESEDRTFRFSIGTESPTNENAIGTNFLTGTAKLTVRKPAIGATLALDGDSSETHIAKAGKPIRADLTLRNNLGAKITDLKVAIKPTGEIFDPNSVSVSSGFYRSVDGTVVWDQTLRPALAVFNPDDSLTLSFSLGTLPESAVRAIRNPEMSLAMTVTGKSQTESGGSQDITATLSAAVRVASTLGLSARPLYYSGSFSNSGPIPPKVDRETSYTIVWALTNGSNDLGNVKMSATLPSYVKWLGATAPSGEKITYNPIGGQVLWDVGALKAGAGFDSSPREVSFQVSIIPSITQANSTPTLVSEVVASGEDGFAGTVVQTSSRFPLTTELSTDVGFRQGEGIVVR